MINSAYILPHSPLLIPPIGKENLSILENTQKAILQAAQLIKDDNPDTILILTPHGIHSNDTLVLNAAPNYHLNFKDFGDFVINNQFKSDLKLSKSIYNALNQGDNIQVTTEPSLDHGSGVPLYYIANTDIAPRITPLHTSNQDLKHHYNLGKSLKEVILKDEKKITIIASGELSHKHSENSSLGYSKKAKKFDQKIIDSILNKDTKRIIDINNEVLDDIEECGLRAIAMLLGIMDKYNYSAKLISYENPFGVGHVAFNMDF